MKGCIVGVNSDSCTDWHLKYFTKLQSNIDEMFPFQFLFDRQKSERKIKDNPHIVSRSEGPRSSRARVDYPLSGRLLGLNELLYRDYSRGWRWHCCPISQIQIRDALHQHPPQLLRNHLKYIDNTTQGRVRFQ